MCNWNRQVLTKEYEKTETKTTIVRHSSTYFQSGCLSVSRKTHFFRVKANETMWVDAI